MYESPRIRRLKNDLAALERLAAESSIFRFQAAGKPPNAYTITFNGKGLSRDRGKVRVVHSHKVEIKLGVSYPRTIPELRWLTPVYHPNISEIGMICLGGYGTHWVPSVQLDELCTMLWDMARYHNYDIRSPYNRDAALWVANQSAILFPTDPRPLRDLRAAQGRVAEPAGANGRQADSDDARSRRRGLFRIGSDSGPPTPIERVRRFMEGYGWSRSEDESMPRPSPGPDGLAARDGEVWQSAGAGPIEGLAIDESAAAPAPPGTPVEEAPPPSPSGGDQTPASAPPPAADPPLPADEPEPVLILDWDAPTPAASPRPSPGGEEILFIE
ncbi:Ubiquitin-conjugating enzyme [Aquisphaera giovannonii]|uniref:Ubiquitin-conjugating enzyme n=1 Tax=Aquisphaera giovannonii TaxID=406548 RepID=A0A5B9VWG6_9BACT|nr:ubiquitin-conjugating enzyme E2 [Aquisphaera giovannonii]QEH32287.1 Ubiquitin-conjugating enzyme [Aquisphaera giovannonii]